MSIEAACLCGRGEPCCARSQCLQRTSSHGWGQNYLPDLGTRLRNERETKLLNKEHFGDIYSEVSFIWGSIYYDITKCPLNRGVLRVLFRGFTVIGSFSNAVIMAHYFELSESVGRRTPRYQQCLSQQLERSRQ